MTTTGPATAGSADLAGLSPPGIAASVPVRQVSRFTVSWQNRREQ
jgi:hypothetical protein